MLHIVSRDAQFVTESFKASLDNDECRVDARKAGHRGIMSTACRVTLSSLPQRAGADLQARISGEFRALHQILHDEESAVLEQLRKEQQEELEKVQRHLQAAELAVRDLEDNIRALQRASADTENVVVTEVRSRLGAAVKLRRRAALT